MSITTSHEGIIEVTHCETAEEFLDYLQLRNLRWLDTNATVSSWVFRGQKKADWSLIPKSMRTDWFDEFKTKRSDKVRQMVDEPGRFTFRGGENLARAFEFKFLDELILQVAAEWHYVAQFVGLADQVGYAIPEDKTYDDISRASLEDIVNLLMRKPDAYHPRVYRFDPIQIEFSLAQHHGIPTRLLDCTDMSFAAAFFAAEDAVKCTDPPDYEIAVWAIHRDALTNSDLQEVRPRRGKIEYLHAQSGLFVYDTMANKNYMEKGKWRSFTDVIAHNEFSDNQPRMRKVTLTAKQAKELLRLLSIENITRAHLMPTYDNISETLKMRQLIQKDTP